jgi:hypothetical protein
MIPQGLENLILDGKARFETYQAGFTELNVIPVENKEFIVVTGYSMTPANRAAYSEPSAFVTSTIQRIEFFDGDRYNHFIHKMGGGGGQSDNFTYDYHNQHGLYMVFHNDVGVMVTVPINENVNLTGFRADLDGSNGNSAARVVQQGTNPYLTTPQSVQYLTESASVGTANIPSNRSINSDDYSNSMNGGPFTGQTTNQFQFTTEDGPVYYNAAANYNAIGPDDYRINWYLNVQYVRVYQQGIDIR